MSKNDELQEWSGLKDPYKRMVEEIQDYAIIVMDKHGVIRNWNKGAQKLKLYSEEEIIGQHFSIFYLPEDIAIDLPAKLLGLAQKFGRAVQEGWRKKKDGSVFWGSITISAFHDDKGNVIGFSKITRDLTERKISEDNLRKSEERYHQMVAEVQDYAIILLNSDGIIQNWNTGAEKIKGYKAHEVIGKNFEIFYPPADRNNKLPSQLLKAATELGKATHEGWRLKKDGDLFWGTIVITALHNKDGAVIGFSKVTRDLTEKKMAEDKLALYTEELEKQNKELEEFAFVASHDLQEPLRKIQTFSELIQANYHDQDFVRKYMIKLNLSAKRMSSLIRSLLYYSRLSNDQLIAEKKEVDLNVLLEEVKVDFELLIAEKNANIRCEALPTVVGNHLQLGQLFSNLLSNSLKYTKGSPLVELSSTIVSVNEISDAPQRLTADQYHAISFRDNGIGFDQQYKNLIFDLFKRLHGKHEYGGAGIGLALCKKIIENHNGFMTAYSEEGNGATFIIYLPLHV